MNNEIRAAMYGANKKPVTEDKAQPVETSTNVSVKGGYARVQSGKDQVIVPTQEYMKAIEKRLDSLERAVKRLETHNRQAARVHNQVRKELTNIRVDLNGKLDIRD